MPTRLTSKPATSPRFLAPPLVPESPPIVAGASPFQAIPCSRSSVPPFPSFLPPTSPSFPDTTQGASSAPQTLTVISSGNTTLHISAVSLAGPNPSDFNVIDNCTAPLAPGVNCPLSLVFNPAAPGQRIADLLIADDASGSPQTLVLSGTGIALVPALSLSPPVPSFPATTQGTSGAPQTLSLINSGNAPLQVASVSISGSNASEFSPTSNCTAPLAPAAS